MKISCNILKPNFFLKYMKSMGEFCDEGLIHFNNGIRFVGIDASRIAIMELIMGEDTVEINSNKKLSAPIRMSDLSKIIARFSKPKSLILEYDEVINKLIIKGDINNKKKTFRLATIEMDSNFEDPIPALSKIRFNTVFKIPCNDILDAVKDGEIFAESVRFKTDGSIFIISAHGTMGDTKTRIDTGIEIFGSEISSYSIRYLKKILTPMSGSDIIIMYKKDFPLSIYDKISPKSHMLYYLGPIVLDVGEDYEDDDLID